MESIYLKIGENGELEKGFYKNKKVIDGFMSLETAMETIPKIIIKYDKLCYETENLLNEWKKDNLHNIYYQKEFDKLDKQESSLYKTYYYMIHAILTTNEIETIQKEIDYNFMSLSFFARMKDLFKYSNKLEDIKKGLGE